MGDELSTELEIWVGTYSPADEEGIVRLRFDAGQGTLYRSGGTSGIDRPAFLAAAPGNRMLFAVSESTAGHVVSYGIDPMSRNIAERNRMSSGGEIPCHLSLDPSGKWLLVANYKSGTVSVHPVMEDGTAGPSTDLAIHRGSSINVKRQEAPHPHSVYPIPSTSCWLVSDLGTDTIYTYRLHPVSGKLTLIAEAKARPGTGPRHLAFHPALPIVYSIEELASSITVYALDPLDGSLAQLQTLSTLPDGYTGRSSCAEVVVSRSGLYVYGSNRGHDSIAVFRAAADGRLTPAGHAPSGGLTPRHIALTPDGSHLLAANQDSNSVVVLKLDEGGIPQPTGLDCSVYRPTCLVVVGKT